jgi:hypothetical protein
MRKREGNGRKRRRERKRKGNGRKRRRVRKRSGNGRKRRRERKRRGNGRVRMRKRNRRRFPRRLDDIACASDLTRCRRADGETARVAALRSACCCSGRGRQGGMLKVRVACMRYFPRIWLGLGTRAGVAERLLYCQR